MFSVMITDLILFFKKDAGFRPAEVSGRSDLGKLERVLRWWNWRPGERSGQGGRGGVVKGRWGVETGGKGRGRVSLNQFPPTQTPIIFPNPLCPDICAYYCSKPYHWRFRNRDLILILNFFLFFKTP
jgi:hypothetical protein